MRTALNLTITCRNNFESLRMAVGISVSTSSSTLSKGISILGMVSMALRLERYTLDRMRAANSHKPAVYRTRSVTGSQGTPGIVGENNTDYICVLIRHRMFTFLEGPPKQHIMFVCLLYKEEVKKCNSDIGRFPI